MSKKSIIALSSICILCILASTFVTVNNLKGFVTDKVFDDYKIELLFNKPIEHSIFSPGDFVFKDVSVKNEGKEILKIGKIVVKSHLLSLIKKKIIVDGIYVEDFYLSINATDQKKLTEKIKSKKKLTKKNIDDEHIPEAIEFSINSFVLKNINLKYQKEIQINNLNLISKIDNKKITLDSLSLNSFGGEYKMDGNLFYGDKPFKADVQGSYSKIDLSLFNHFLKSQKKSLKGNLSFDYNLKWQDDKAMKPEGNFHARAKKLTLSGINIDKLLEGFIDSREVGALDIASYMTLGPLGALVTNSLESSKSLLGLNSGTSKFTHINIKTEFNDGIANLSDVAFSTKENRVSVAGKINLNKKIFKNFFVYILNKKGCARILQRVSGSLLEPDIGVTQTISEGVISPVTDLLKKTKELVDCKPVYRGVVKHPET